MIIKDDEQHNVKESDVTYGVNHNIKESEQDVRDGLKQLMSLVKVLINKWIPKYKVALPDWEYFKYNI